MLPTFSFIHVHKIINRLAHPSTRKKSFCCLLKAIVHEIRQDDAMNITVADWL